MRTPLLAAALILAFTGAARAEGAVDAITGAMKRVGQSTSSEARQARLSCDRAAGAPRPRLPPPHHQGETQWCYAYVAADLLTDKLGWPVSALDLVLARFPKKTDRKPKPDDSIADLAAHASPFEALEKAAARGGVCREEDVPSGPLGAASTTQVARYRRLEALAEKASDGRKNAQWNHLDPEANGSGERCTPGYQSASDADGIVNQLCVEHLAEARELFPNASGRDFFDALRPAAPTDMIRSLADASCRRQPLAAPSVVQNEVRDDAAADGAYRDISERLREGRPVAIVLNKDALLDRQRARRGSGHWALLIDARWREGQGCELLLRNSYGATCGHNGKNYDASYDCDPALGVWLPAEVVVKTLSGYGYLR